MKLYKKTTYTQTLKTGTRIRNKKKGAYGKT